MSSEAMRSQCVQKCMLETSTHLLICKLAYSLDLQAVNIFHMVFVRGGGEQRLYLRKGDWRRLCLVHLPLIFCLGNYT